MWHGPHPTRRFTRIFTVIGPLGGLWPTPKYIRNPAGRLSQENAVFVAYGGYATVMVARDGINHRDCEVYNKVTSGSPRTSDAEDNTNKGIEIFLKASALTLQ
jgi:hypothetical protein